MYVDNDNVRQNVKEPTKAKQLEERNKPTTAGGPRRDVAEPAAATGRHGQIKRIGVVVTLDSHDNASRHKVQR